MTTAHIRATQANCTFYCGGAQIRAYARQLATVVTVRGEIDADNVERVTGYIRRFTLGEKPVVVDMSEVTHFASAVADLLHTFDRDCDSAGVEWTLVASLVVIELLCGADATEFPITGSMHEALRNLADAIASRRQQVLPLIKKTA